MAGALQISVGTQGGYEYIVEERFRGRRRRGSVHPEEEPVGVGGLVAGAEGADERGEGLSGGERLDLEELCELGLGGEELVELAAADDDGAEDGKVGRSEEDGFAYSVQCLVLLEEEGLAAVAAVEAVGGGGG